MATLTLDEELCETRNTAPPLANGATSRQPRGRRPTHAQSPAITSCADDAVGVINQVDFMQSRMAQARAVITVSLLVFGGEYPEDERPSFECIFGSITFASRLLVECLDHDISPAFVAAPGYADWLALTGEAHSLLKMHLGMVWGGVVEKKQILSDDVTCYFLWAVDGAIERGLNALEAIGGGTNHV